MKPIFRRWIKDLNWQFSKILKDPLGSSSGSGAPWHDHFDGELMPEDTFYGVFLGILSVLVAGILALFAKDEVWKVLAQFFRAPVHFVVTGMLMSLLIFIGARVNRIETTVNSSLKLMLRVLSVYPFLCFANALPYGQALLTLGLGFFVIRSARHTLSIPLRNAVLFWGMAYGTFAVLEVKRVIMPPNPVNLRMMIPGDHSESTLPSSKETTRTSSSSSNAN